MEFHNPKLSYGLNNNWRSWMRKLNPVRHGYTLFLKTGPACNAGCISCPGGRKAPEEMEKVPLMNEEMFDRITDRILQQANIISVVLHYYNEPTLNPHMPGIIAIAKKKNIPSIMSTNGSYPENLKKCMAAGLDNLIFSVSGWTQEIHTRSHKHTNIELIKESMKYTSEHLKKGQLVRVGWHDYKYNEHEQDLMRQYVEGLGFKFTPYHTSVLPLEIPLRVFEEVRKGNNPEPHIAERDLRMPLTKAAKLCMERKHFTCVYQERMITLDGRGDLWNCAAKAIPSNKRESVFNIDIEYFQKRRYSDPDCVSCKSLGGHVYGTQKYDASLSLAAALRRKAEDTYRSLGIGSIAPALTRRIHNFLYERPGKRSIVK